MLKKNAGILILLSGPSGSGKTTLCAKMLDVFKGSLRRVVTATTRVKRPGEKNGVDYHFLSESDFQKSIDTDSFYEYAVVYGNKYGTLKREVDSILSEGCDAILAIDVQGVRSFKRMAEGNDFLARSLVTVFIKPSSISVIRDRLNARGSESEAEIDARMTEALNELEEDLSYDYCITTSSVNVDFDLLSSIYLKEKKLRCS